MSRKRMCATPGCDGYIKVDPREPRTHRCPACERAYQQKARRDDDTQTVS